MDVGIDDLSGEFDKIHRHTIIKYYYFLHFFLFEILSYEIIVKYVSSLGWMNLEPHTRSGIAIKLEDHSCLGHMMKPYSSTRLDVIKMAHNHFENETFL